MCQLIQIVEDSTSGRIGAGPNKEQHIDQDTSFVDSHLAKRQSLVNCSIQFLSQCNVVYLEWGSARMYHVTILNLIESPSLQA